MFSVYILEIIAALSYLRLHNIIKIFSIDSYVYETLTKNDLINKHLFSI